MGCDEPCAKGEEQYAITCVSCDGSEIDPATGETCEVCTGHRYPGFQPQRRCPRSQMTGPIASALDALAWVRRGMLPVTGGTGSQSPTFLQFVAVFESEVSRVEAERQEQERLKSLRRGNK